jgi:hypothetical protein
MPMNATWPNDTMPLFPMNAWIETTSMTFTRNITNVRLDDEDPNACTSAIPPINSIEMSPIPQRAGRSRLAGIGLTRPPPALRTDPEVARRGSPPR